MEKLTKIFIFVPRSFKAEDQVVHYPQQKGSF